MIELRRFMPEHITSDYLSWLNNKELMKYSRQRFNTHTAETSLAYLRSFDDTPNYFWAVFAEREMIGTANAYIKDGVADVGILIGQCGKGYGHETWLRILKCLSEMGLKKITAGTHKENIPMIKIMQDSGMTPTHDNDENVYYAIIF